LDSEKHNRPNCLIRILDPESGILPQGGIAHFRIEIDGRRLCCTEMSTSLTPRVVIATAKRLNIDVSVVERLKLVRTTRAVIEGGLDGYDSTLIVRQDSLENLRERIG
jgi:hypothetical protein